MDQETQELLGKIVEFIARDHGSSHFAAFTLSRQPEKEWDAELSVIEIDNETDYDDNMWVTAVSYGKGESAAEALTVLVDEFRL
jgi:hypothetical protein